MTKSPPEFIPPIIGSKLAHDSAKKHVTGRAIYVDDMPEPAGLLHVQLGRSSLAHGSLDALDLSAVREAAGVVRVLVAEDVPGRNDVSPFSGDEPALAEGTISYYGQALFAVAAESRRAAQLAIECARVHARSAEALVTVDEALDADSELETERRLTLNDIDAALSKAPQTLHGQMRVGGQDHLYLEGQIAMAVPGEDETLTIYSSTQHPSEVQQVVARVLNKPVHAITVEVRRMGGAFGGKETQPAHYAALAALVAHHTGRPAKLRLDRDDDMIMTGKRHDFAAHWQVGFDDQGRLLGLDMQLASRCGHSADLSSSVNDRAMFHADNAYYLGAARIRSKRMRTHTVSNTAFRGFGGPQSMVATERMMDEIAMNVGRDPLDVRLENLYRPGATTTPYGQEIDDFRLADLMRQLAETSEYRARRAAIEIWNRENDGAIRRGIALTPVKFGISFTATHLNQAGALVNIYLDGSVQLNHGGTEMGQGLYIKVAQVVAGELGLSLDDIRIMATVTDKVPNTSATAASAGSDLNGMAARDACRKLKRRLAEVACAMTGHALEDCDRVSFADGVAFVGETTVAWKELVRETYMRRVSLSATGFYRTPKIHFDKATGKGRPFFYYGYGAAVSEVAVDGFTGENRVLRVDVLHGCGRSLNPAIDLGQIEGGFIQGMGWLTTEELYYAADGALKTHAPSTYKIPVASDCPEEFNLDFWDDENTEDTIFRSKAVGEPPLMLAISVLCALHHAVCSYSGYRVSPRLDAPATAERVLMAIHEAKNAA